MNEVEVLLLKISTAMDNIRIEQLIIEEATNKLKKLESERKTAVKEVKA